MKIVSWNVNGLRAVHRKGNWRDIFTLKPDVLCLQEIKAQKEQLPEDVQNVDGFYAYFNSSQTKKGYSGTALYSKRKPLSVSYDIPQDITEKHNLCSDAYGEPNREGRVIAAEFPEVFVVTVYTPNSKEDLSRLPLRHDCWDPAFLEYCVTLQNKKPVIFCGDLNVAHNPIDLARPKPNEGNKGYTTEERRGVDNMLEEGFLDTLRLFEKGEGQYTWWSPWGGARERNVGWRIDYVFAGEQLEEKIQGAAIHPDIMGSDHCPVSADFDL
ncbi:exodeoxyribonuclease III [Candidatus Kaiserbacteria bacterium]|nr:MAG: exodeoxyribonuclease III [Candidatus Kaiserbacteria bacterium]